MESIFDETLPWNQLPHFIQERIYWRPMVHARNEMGWKALHEQLFPLAYKQMQCWDCGYTLKRAEQLSDYKCWGFDFENVDYHFYCPGCLFVILMRIMLIRVNNTFLDPSFCGLTYKQRLYDEKKMYIVECH